MNFRSTFLPLFSIETKIAIGVFAAVAAALIFVMVRYRARPGRKPWKRDENTPLEITYILAVAAIAGFLVARTATANAAEDRIPGPTALTVNVTGFQWCWRFSYPGEHVTVAADCLHNNYPTLVLPTNRKIRVNVTSTDVVHAFWVPYLKYKMDAFPHHVNTFTTILTHTGRWPGRCAEFCGLHHDSMQLWVQAVTPAQFTTWLHSHAAAVAG